MTNFIHYGSTKFDITRFQPIRNGRLMNKPHGGLWASPVDSEYGWSEWCKGEDFYVDNLAQSFTFSLSSSARLMTIDSLDDMLKLPVVASDYEFFHISKMIDYEMLAQSWDAVWLTENGQAVTRFVSHTHGFDLYGWDCECILVLNPDVIQPARVDIR